MLAPMWVDQRGSEVLPRAECLRLLAVAAGAGAVGRIAVVTDPEAAPLLRPVNFGFHDGYVLLRLGYGSLAAHVGDRLVAFEVDGIEGEPGPPDRRAFGWSVLVGGLAVRVQEDTLAAAASHHLPGPLVPMPGEQLYTVRPDLVSGRRFPVHDADASPVVRH